MIKFKTIEKKAGKIFKLRRKPKPRTGVSGVWYIIFRANSSRPEVITEHLVTELSLSLSVWMLVFHSVGTKCRLRLYSVVIIPRNIQACLAHRPLRVTQISVIDTRASTPLSKAPISKTCPLPPPPVHWSSEDGKFLLRHREILNDPYRTI